MRLTPPCQTNNYHEAHIALLLNSYQHLLKQPLLETSTGLSMGQQVFEADFALLSHNTDDDPLFNYSNNTALKLFGFSWDEFIGMPSRLSAEPINRHERERLLAQVTVNGYIDNYSGLRIAKTGQRFLIQRAIVWNIYDKQQHYYGQAAWFKDWCLLDSQVS